MEIDALVQNKIDADVDFQATLTDLSDEDKEVALNEKRTELIKQEYSALSDKATKAEEIANNQKIRAEKAEELAKQLKTQPVKKEESELPKKSEGYSLQDIRALSDVHDEDVQEVVDFAKFKGITITEAKKNPTVQTILKQKTEERATAAATNTAVSRKGASKVSSEDLLDKFNQGDVPEKEEDLKKVIEARWTAKEK